MHPGSPGEEDLFHRALALPAAERAAFLDRECAGDARLRAAVDSLLKLHDDANRFMKSAAPGLAETVAQFAPRPEEKPGDRIGRYKLLQQVGKGGCGVVYMAEQEEPVRRRVALKVIKLGMDTKAVIARFEAERQALAMMDHPNIAKVLDAGSTETGRPFFVMELVRGVPITKYCDESNLPTPARLKLFIQVCQAVQHAHQKGIIHRDLKPSNILVTLHDGVPVPKVIDFGIAKATQGRLTDQTLFTAFEQFIGTPAYMSPEQAELSGLDIDTRSDIYSLGVLLYELLTGKPPFDPKTFLEAGLDEMRRIIREVEPPKPSTRLGTLTNADQSTIAKLRGIMPAQLSTLLRGDLDWIVMRCLEKDRTRRYETATSLAQDIQRHLTDEPVVACPPSNLYRFQKLVRRNQLPFAAAAAVVAVLVVGLGVSTWAYFKEKAAREFAVQAALSQRKALAAANDLSGNIADVRRQAQASEKKAKVEAARSAYSIRLLKEMLKAAGSKTAPARDPAPLRETLDHTAEHLGQDTEIAPEAQQEFYEILGDAYMNLGEFGRAENMYRELLTLRRKPRGLLHQDTEAALNKLIEALKRQGKSAEAESEIDAARLQRLKFLKTGSGVQSLANLARELQRQGKYAEAEANLWEAIDIYKSRIHSQAWAEDMYLGDIAAGRFEAGDMAGARQLTMQWLQAEKGRRSWSLGVATSFGTVHHGTIYRANALLGRIALREGNKQAASGYLLKAGRQPGARHYVFTHGILDYTLAAELLAAGEGETVIRFLDEVGEFYVAGWENWPSGRHAPSVYDSSAIGRENAANLAQWRKDVSEGRVPEDWKKQMRRAPSAAAAAALPPIPSNRVDSTFVRELRSLFTRLDFPFAAQMLGWAVAIPILRRRAVSALGLPARASTWFAAFAFWRISESLLLLGMFAGPGLFYFEMLSRIGPLFPIATWAILWELVRALRGETSIGRLTTFLRVALSCLAVFVCLVAMFHPPGRSPDFIYWLTVLAIPFSIVVPIVVGLAVAREFSKWAKTAFEGRMPSALCGQLAARILGLQSITCIWEIIGAIQSLSPPAAFAIVCLNALLPWLLAAGIVLARPAASPSTAAAAAV